MSLASGTHLGVYENLGPIGAGGLGEVDRAHDTKLAWLPDSRRFVFATGEHTMAVINTVTRSRRALGPFPFQVQPTSPAVSPDGRAIFVGALHVEADVWMVEQTGKQEE